jgi:hypothetical protein
MLKSYEEQILLRMYDELIIGHKYKTTQKIASIIGWDEIAKKHGVRKKFQSVLRHLISKGYIEGHGKRGKAGSLSRFGVLYVIGRKDQDRRIP